MIIPKLSNREKAKICRTLLKSNPAFKEIIEQKNGEGGRWEPFVDALALLLGVKIPDRIGNSENELFKK